MQEEKSETGDAKDETGGVFACLVFHLSSPLSHLVDFFSAMQYNRKTFDWRKQE
jgi:hypothetical protein